MAIPPLAPRKATKGVLQIVFAENRARRPANGVKRLLHPIQVRAARLVGIADVQEPRRERLQFIDVAILFVPEMNADEYLLESGHRTSG